MGISTTDPNLPAYIYAGTSVGSVYVRNAENDTQWWSLGSPAGPGVVDSLSLVPKVGATLLNSYGLLYKRDYSDGVWRKVGQY